MRISDWSSDVCSSDLSCLHRHGIADPLHQPIIILRGPQRPASVGLSCKIAAEQIDEIQVGGMGERSATKPAQRQYGRSEEHTSELQSLMRISYAVFCLKKKTSYINIHHNFSVHSTIQRVPHTIKSF